MTEHLSAEQIEAYRKRSMAPASMLAADEHLAQCEPCRAKLDATGQVTAALSELSAGLRQARAGPDHLSYELMESYANNATDAADREIVESHIELCRMCAAEVKDLQAFAAALAAQPAIEGPEPSVWQKFLALLRSPAQWKPSWLEGAVRSFSQPRSTLVHVAVVAAVISLPLILLGWIVLHPFSTAPTEIATAPTNTARQASPMPGENRNTNRAGGVTSEPEIASITPTPQVSPEPSGSSVLIAALLPSRAKGPSQAKTLRLPPGATAVQLSLSVAEYDYASYRATLLTPGGGRRSLGTRKAPRSGKLFFTLPASQLAGGEYRLSLTGIRAGGEEEPADEYDFKIVKQR